MNKNSIGDGPSGITAAKMRTGDSLLKAHDIHGVARAEITLTFGRDEGRTPLFSALDLLALAKRMDNLDGYENCANCAKMLREFIAGGDV